MNSDQKVKKSVFIRVRPWFYPRSFPPISPAPFNSKTFLISVATCCFLGVFSGAALDSPDTPSDFAPVFEMLRELGLPDTKGAEYGAIDFREDRRRRVMRRHSDLDLSGNAWLVSGEPRLCVYDGAWKMDFVSNRHGWSSQKIENDLKQVLRFLEKKNYQEYHIRSLGPRLLFMAAHAHRNGYTNEANRLTQLLCEACGGSRQLAARAINSLAQTRTAETIQQFHAQPDFSELARQLDEVLERYTDYWPERQSVALLRAKAQNQNQTDDISGVLERVAPDLSPADRALLAGLFDPASTAQNLQWLEAYSYTDWVMNAPPSGQEANPSSMFLILSKGMEAIPLLVALLDVETLTPMVDMSKINYGLSGGDPFNLNPDIAEIYQNMFRPYEAREIATVLLASGMGTPGSLRLNRNQSAAAFYADAKRQALAFYEQNQGKDRSDILAEQLESQEQRDQAIVAILDSGDPELLQLLKGKLLEWPVSFVTIGYALSTAENAPEVADTAFIKQFRQRVPKDLDSIVTAFIEDSHYPEEYRPQLRKQLQDQVDMLDQILTPPDLKEALAAIALEDDSVANAAYFLQQDPEGAVSLMLEYVVSEEEPLRVQRVTHALFNLLSQVEEGTDFKSAVGEELWKRAWLKLLDNDRPFRGTIQASNRHYVTLSDLAVGAFEMALVKSEPDAARVGAVALFPEGPRMRDEVRKQMRRYVESGQTGPMTISMEEAPEERGTALKAEFEGTTTREELDRLFGKLTPGELMRATNVIGEDEKLDAKLLPLANTFTEVAAIGEAKMVEGIPQVGDVLTRERIDQLIGLSKAGLRDGKPVAIRILRPRVPEGLFILVEPPPPVDMVGWVGALSKYGNMIFGSLTTGENAAYLFEPLDELSPEAQEEGLAQQLASTREQFETILKEFVVNEKGNSTRSFELVFYPIIVPNEENRKEP